MPRLSTLVLCAAAAVATSCVLMSADAASVRPTTTDPARAAAGWLSQQFTDHLNYPGFNSFDGGSTADAVFALSAARSGKDQIDRSMRYFAAHVDDYTNLQDTTGKPGPYDGSVGKTAVAALVAGLDPRSFGGHDLIAALKKDQCTQVSAPKNSKDYTTPTCPAIGAGRNIYSSVSESFVILAQARAAALYGAGSLPDQAALNYFYSLQCPDGGFTVQTTTTAGCASDSDSTAYALMALEALRSAPTAKVNAAVGWLTHQEQRPGYWVSQGGPNVDSTGLAAAALDGEGVDTAQARNWLSSQQVTTGPTVGTGASRGALQYEGKFDASTAVKATSDGILGMVRHGSLASLTDTGATAGTAVLALAAPTVSAGRPHRGSTIRVAGTGFSRDEAVRVTLAAARVASATADNNGTVRAVVVVPRSAPLGRQAVSLSGETSGLAATASVHILAALSAPAPRPTPPPAQTPTPPAAPQPILANTGPADLQGLLAGGFGCLVLGALALLGGRRRRA